MRIIDSQYLRGLNIYSPRSTLVIQTDFDAQAALLHWRPNQTQREIFEGRYRDIFPERLRPLAKTWADACAVAAAGFPDLTLKLAQAALADQAIAPHCDGLVLDNEASVLRVALPCDDAEIGQDAWILAVPAALWCVALSHNEALPSQASSMLVALHDKLRATVQTRGLNQLTLALVRAAAKRDIPWCRLAPMTQFVQLGHGCLRRRINETMLDGTGHLPVRIAANKAVTGHLLRELNLPAPAFAEVGDETAALQAAAAIGYPVVVKPVQGKKGHAVAVGLRTEAEVKTAFHRARAAGGRILVQALVTGDDHRLLVVDGKLIAAALRQPASVTGDGRHTIGELIAILNRDPRRGRDYALLLEQVDLDHETLEVLTGQGLGPNSVPATGQFVALRRTANISRGGTAVDVTDTVHPDNRRVVERAARGAGLDVAGIDFITPDISRSWREAGGAIIEINPNPGLRPHWIGTPTRDVVSPILDRLFPPGARARIPTCAITGSLGKTTTSRMVAAIARAGGKSVGLCVTQGVYLNDDLLQAGDLAGGKYAERLLTNPEVETGVFEFARGGLLKHGMTIDGVDVGAVLNIRGQHLGQDGIATQEQLARIKRLVVESARAVAVLNAEDAYCLAMREHTHARICLVGTSDEVPAITAHLRLGGAAFVLEGSGADERIAACRSAERESIIDVAEIAASYGGTARVKIVNALFAAAIASEMGFAPADIRAGLRGMQSSYEQNPGRLNVIDLGGFKVILDSSSSVENIAALEEFTKIQKPAGRRILLLTGPGNRPDSHVLKTGRAAAGRFDHYLCSDRTDRRGRPAGEVAALLKQGLIEGGTPESAIAICPDEATALQTLLSMGRTGDLLAIITFSHQEAIAAIRSHGK